MPCLACSWLEGKLMGPVWHRPWPWLAGKHAGCVPVRPLLACAVCTHTHQPHLNACTACRAGSKNILRGFFLAFLATFCGCFFFYTLPDAVAAQLGRVMPIWFYEGQVSGGCQPQGLQAGHRAELHPQASMLGSWHRFRAFCLAAASVCPLAPLHCICGTSPACRACCWRLAHAR